MMLGGVVQRAFAKDRYIPCDAMRSIPMKIAVQSRKETLRSIEKETIGEYVTNK